MLRLGMGVLLETMLRRMEEADNTSLHLYSGHDSSLMPLLAALGHQVADWPPYLSNLVLELWQRPGGSGGERYVKVRAWVCGWVGAGAQGQGVWGWGEGTLRCIDEVPAALTCPELGPTLNYAPPPTLPHA